MTLDQLLTLAKQQNGANQRCERYRRRLDEHLDTLRDDKARLMFVIRELQNWNERYRAWAARVDAGHVDTLGLTAWDFTETIADLDQRKAKFTPRVKP